MTKLILSDNQLRAKLRHVFPEVSCSTNIVRMHHVSMVYVRKDPMYEKPIERLTLTSYLSSTSNMVYRIEAAYWEPTDTLYVNNDIEIDKVVL